MRYHLFFLLFFLGCSQMASAQGQVNRTPEPRFYRHLQGNEAKVMFNPGSLFWDGLSRAQFQVPYQSGANTPSVLFAGGLWLGAIDNGGNLRVAAQTYRGSGNDYWAGPVDSSTGQVLADGARDFDYIWSVKRWEIEAHQQDYAADGIINAPVPASISNWPGRGNPQFANNMGYALPDQSLAPFYDRNSNGLYEPLLGDYPVFDHNDPNAVAEDMLWYVYNDAAGSHTQSTGFPLKAEVQVTAWSFYCQGDSLLNRSIFVRHKVINRDAMDWVDFRMGLWHDADLGCNGDDYMGVDTTLRTVYWYNADNNDDNPCGAAGPAGYGIDPPAQTMTFLNQPLSSVIYNTNSSTDPRGTPTIPFGYYRPLSGVWPNSTPITPSGDGYNPSSTLPPTRYVFNGSITDPNTWTMVSSQLSGIDLRDLASTHVPLIRSGESFTLDVAYAYHRGSSGLFQNALLALQQVPQVQQWYDSGFNFPNCTQPTPCSSNCVYPGDMNNNGIANDYDLLDWAVAVGQNANAAPRSSIQDNWFPHDLPAPATNGYLDANGDGSIDHTDWDVNTDNLGLVHSLYTGAPEGSNTQGDELVLRRFHFPPNVSLPLLRPNTSAKLNIELDSTPLPTDQLYGLVFQIEYDTRVFFNPSWRSPHIGPFQKTRKRRHLGQLHFAGVRTDGSSIGISGSVLEQFFLFVRADAPFPQPLMQTDICLRNIKAIDSLGNVIPLGSRCLTVEYADSNYSISVSHIDAAEYLARLYPNPTANQTTLELVLEQPQSIQIQLLDVTGRVVYEQASQSLAAGEHHLSLSTAGLPAGVYYCRIASERQQQVLSLIKQ